MFRIRPIGAADEFCKLAYVADLLVIDPVFRAEAQIRRASSSCCGAKLNPGAGPETFTCRECGQACERVMSEPEEVTIRG